MRPRTKTALALGTGVAVVALGVGIALWVTSSGGTSRTSSTTGGQLSYATLWRRAVAGKTSIDVLRQWPKPYQHYTDGNGNDCYEWDQKPVKLYNLCFKHGVLQAKSLA